MRTYLKLFCLVLPIMIALDASWIGVIASGFYKANLGALLSPTPNFLAAGLFYVLYAIGLIFFVLKPALTEHSFTKAILSAAALGFIAYMTYDLTNLSVLPGWPMLLTVVDIVWGVILTSVTSGLTYLIATKVFTIEPGVA